MVHFYKPLWIGEQAKKKQVRIRYAVKYGIRMNGAYYIALAKRPGDLLDIIPCSMPISNKKSSDTVHVIGLAWGKDEAKEVVTQIIDEVYQNTGGFDLVSYMKEKR